MAVPADQTDQQTSMSRHLTGHIPADRKAANGPPRGHRLASRERLTAAPAGHHPPLPGQPGRMESQRRGCG